MKNKRIPLIIILICFLGIGAYLTYDFITSSQQKPKETPVQVAPKKEPPKKVEILPMQTVYKYDAENFRDPFSPLIVKRQVGQKISSPLETYDVEELKLTGIVFDKKGYFALIQTPDGKFHIAKEKEKVGAGGMITKIGKDYIEIKETQAHGGFATKTKQLKLRTEE